MKSIVASKHHIYKIKENYMLNTALKIQTEVLMATHDFFHKTGYIQLLPVVLSSITDPLNHPVHNLRIEYLNQELQLTKSMILHKQIAIATLGVKGFYIMSPNIRLEMSELKKTGRHLIEFMQVDIEIKESTAREFMSLIEDLIIHIFKRVKSTCGDELEKEGITLNIPQKPFKVYQTCDLKKKFGSDYEHKASLNEKDPFWITDHEREFYDKEDPKQKGHYINYDLVYPEGFGEALSGGERDYEYEILARKIKERNQDLKHFEPYLKLAKEEVLIPSVGGGLGIERLVRFLTKSNHIEEVSLFPKLPGEYIDF